MHIILFSFYILAQGNGNISQVYAALHSHTTGSTPQPSAVSRPINLGFAPSNPGTPRPSPHGTPKSQKSHHSYPCGGQYS